MREQFEKLPEICSLINYLSFDDDANEYVAKVQNPFEHDSNECFVNGAWYAYQEQQKKIDAVRSWAKYHIEDFNLQESNNDHDRGWYNASCQVFININNMCGD